MTFSVSKEQREKILSNYEKYKKQLEIVNEQKNSAIHWFHVLSNNGSNITKSGKGNNNRNGKRKGL